MTATPIAALRQVWHHRLDVPILRGVTLDVAAAEHVTLLGGEAGSALMLLAGFAAATSGGVLLDGRDVAGVPPQRRGIAVVHRGLGLFGQMSVAGNVGFSGGSARAVRAMLRLAGLDACAGLRPAALDAAARVRLAIARVLMQRSPLLLLDDPLAGLDAVARRSVCGFVTAARASREFAILHAASDADAAFSGFGVAQERLVVLEGGSVTQEGTPSAVYETPASAAVASLTGPLNMLPGTVLEEFDDEVRVMLHSGAVVSARGHGVGVGDACVVCVRPERMALAAAALADIGDDAFAATVREVTFHRDHWQVGLQLDGGAGIALTVTRPAGVPLGRVSPGVVVGVAWQPHHAMAYSYGQAGGAAVAAPVPGDYRIPAAIDVPPPNVQDRP